MPIRLRGGGGGGSAPAADPKETLNILNGVLSCAWDKTSYSPKLLEIYENSQVKFNVDSDNPLVLAFANGWDDLDRPAQVVKRLAVAPSNIDLSAKANCHVQIVAKVIDGELVITTNDIFDPAWSAWTNIIPSFTSASPMNGWSVSASGQESGHEGWQAVDASPSTYWEGSGGTYYLYVTSPITISLCRYTIWLAGSGASCKLQGYNPETSQWVDLESAAHFCAGEEQSFVLSDSASLGNYTQFRIERGAGGYADMKYLRFYERPTAKFFRSLNKVKDRADVEQLWINLGYAVVDGSGNIIALNHYTDLRNNYPGGMRVEA